MIRVIWRENEEATVDWLKDRADRQEPDEIRLYAWKSVNFREICDMIKEHLARARRRDANFNFSFIRLNLEGGYELKNIGIVSCARKTEFESTTLAQLKFVIGDYIGLNITYGAS